MKTIFIIIAIIVSTTQITNSQDSIKSCDDDPMHSMLDFWVGKWNVYDTNNILVGTNSIEKILNGCAIMENWKDIDGSEGKSLFYVDNNTKKWKQVWVTDNANYPLGQKEKEMVAFSKDSIIFMGKINYNGKTLFDRTILTNEAGGSVIQNIQLSRNNGETWKTGFIGIYKKQ